MQPTMNVRRLRDFANDARTANIHAELQASRTDPDRCRALHARHAPDEAGRYFRAALEDNLQAIRDFTDATGEQTEAAHRAAQYISRAVDAERLAEELRRRSLNDIREVELTERADEARRTADFYRYKGGLAYSEMADSVMLTKESAFALVAISIANPEDPPYLNSSEIEAHRRMIEAARTFIANDKANTPNLVIGPERGESYEGFSGAAHTLAKLCMANLENLPYPQGPPGQARTLDDLDEFLGGLPRLDINDLEPDNRRCHICQEPYPADGIPDKSEVPDKSKPEFPVELPCRHVLGSTCLKRWLTPTKNDTCPFCRSRLT